jgi:hypothetical protein
MDASSAAIGGAWGRVGTVLDTVGEGCAGGGVKARGGFLGGRKQDADASDSATTPKIIHVMRMRVRRSEPVPGMSFETRSRGPIPLRS